MKSRIVVLFLLMAVVTVTVTAKDNLAVLPFTGGTGEDGETIADLFSISNELNEVFAPIPRTRITQAISTEQKFQMGAGMTDPDTIAAIGRQVGAKYVVAGNIAKVGNNNLLIISILKIDELRQIAGAIQTYSKIEDIKDKLPDMARKIIRAKEIDSSKLDKLAVAPVELGGNIDPGVADTLAQILSINLTNSGRYSVYPRTATLKQVEAEYKAQLSGSTADESIVDIGKGDNPKFVLSVVARRLGSQNMFIASIIDMESGILLVGRSVNYNTLDDGIQVMENLARELTGVSAGSLDDDLDAIRNRAIAASGGRTRQSADTPPAGQKAAKPDGNALAYGALNLAAGLGSFVQGDRGGGLTCLLGYATAAGLIVWDVLAFSYKDDLAGVPGAIGFGVAGVTAVYGFIRPFVYKNSHTLAANSGGNAFAYGAMNLALGFGSFIQGDWSGGLTCFLGYATAAGLIIWDALAFSYEDDLAGVPGILGIGVAGVTAVYGFIRPVLYKKNHALAGVMDRIHIAAALGSRGGMAVRLSYTMKF
jgi:TolB-like protein